MDERSALLAWYRRGHRELPWRGTKDPYRVWLSEVMLQQTRVETVKSYYERFLRLFPTVQALAGADPAQLEKAWEGLGYYRRVRNLQKGAIQVVTQFGGVIPRTYAELRSLCGVGDYTAGAIGSICFDLPTPAVDGNAERVYARLFAQQPGRTEIARQLLPWYRSGDCGELTQALMELGATVCIPNGTPKCEECPFFSVCRARSQGQIEAFPQKKPKKSRPVDVLTVFCLRCDTALALRQRGENGLLAGLWELPNVPGKLTAEQAAQQLSRWGVHPLQPLKIVEKSHIFTHREWKMQCHYWSCSSMSDRFIWASPEELASRYALPTAFRKFIEP